jgi:hypothetical protein
VSHIFCPITPLHFIIAPDVEHKLWCSLLCDDYKTKLRLTIASI